MRQGGGSIGIITFHRNWGEEPYIQMTSLMKIKLAITDTLLQEKNAKQLLFEWLAS